jgi:hypothetical protein
MEPESPLLESVLLQLNSIFLYTINVASGHFPSDLPAKMFYADLNSFCRLQLYLAHLIRLDWMTITIIGKECKL